MLEIELDLVCNNFFFDLHQRNDSVQPMMDIFLVGTCVPGHGVLRDELTRRDPGRFTEWFGYEDVGYKIVHACPGYSRVDLSGITYSNSEERLQAGDILQVTNECCIELAVDISSVF
jgi:hypothetical protein